MDMNNTKFTLKRALWLIGFLALTVAVILGFGWIFVPKTNTSAAGTRYARARGFYGEPEDTLEVTIVGNSDAYYALNPLWMFEDYGITSYNCGEPLESLIDAYAMLEEFDSVQNPKVMVLETNLFFLRSGTFEFNTLMQKYVSNIFPMYMYHQRWKSLHSYDFKNETLPYKTTTTKGFSYNVRTYAFDESKYENLSVTASIDPIDKYYLKKLLNLANSKGVSLVLMTTWSPADWSDERGEVCQELADELGVPYFDFNQESVREEQGVDLSTQVDFMDQGNHMNLTGAKKMTAWLGKYLHENYDLTDFRDDERFASWYDDIEKFNAQVEKELAEYAAEMKD